MVIAVMQLFVLSIRCDVVYDWLDSEGDITATESYDFKGEWFLEATVMLFLELWSASAFHVCRYAGYRVSEK